MLQHTVERTAETMARNKKNAAPKQKNKSRGVKSSNWMLWGAAAVICIAIFVLFLTLAQKFFQTEQYFVLNTNVSARTQILPEMLDPITTSEGTAPQAAIGIEEVQSGTIYSQYPLVAGDILTDSNVGGRTDIATGVPDDYVITNFSVGADDAVGGRIQRGYYFDIMAISDGGNGETEKGAFYPFLNVLALDTTVDLSSASSADAAETEEAHAGQTTQYVVGMPPADAARLQQLVESGVKIKLVLSPIANGYQAPDVEAYSGLFNYDQNAAPVNMGENTDYTFSDVERDEFGVPKELPNANSCGAGNQKITGEACETAGITEETAAEDTPVEENTQPTDETTVEENFTNEEENSGN